MQDLDATDLVEIACPCGHVPAMRPMQFAALWSRKRTPDYKRITDLRTRFRCAQMRVARRRLGACRPGQTLASKNAGRPGVGSPDRPSYGDIAYGVCDLLGI